MKGSKKGTGGHTLHKGLSRSMPKACDASMNLPKTSVNSEPTRKGVARTPSTLGPRTA